MIVEKLSRGRIQWLINTRGKVQQVLFFPILRRFQDSFLDAYQRPRLQEETVSGLIEVVANFELLLIRKAWIITGKIIICRLQIHLLFFVVKSISEMRACKSKYPAALFPA